MWKLKDTPKATLTRRQGEKRKGTKGTTITPHRRLPAPEPASAPPPYRHSFWWGTPRCQLSPGSPSPLGRTLLWNIAQTSAGVCICPVSSSSPFQPPSIVSSVGLSTGCSGGRGVPAFGQQSCLRRRRTTRICRPLSGRTVSGRLQLLHAHTVVCRTWWPATSHLSSGQVSWSPFCPCVCSWSACCTSWPPTSLWLLTFPQRFAELCSKPRCMTALSPCFHLHLGRGSPGGLFLCCRACRSVPGPSEVRLWCHGRGEPAPSN